MRLVTVLFVFLCSICQLFAEDPLVVLPAQEVYNGDFFAAGRNIEISGTVNGDVYLAGGTVTIDGQVNGHVLATCAKFDLTGTVEKSCRVIASQILVSGQAKDSFSCMATNLQTTATALLEGNIVAIAGNIDMGAPLRGNLTAVSSAAKISSHIDGDVSGYIGKLRLTSKAEIDGTLDYRSDTPAVIETGAVVKGQVLQESSVINKLMDRSWLHQVVMGSQIIAILMNFMYTLASGYLLLRFFPHGLHSSIRFIGKKPVKALFSGAMVVMLMPLLVLILLVTVLGVPLAFAAMGLNVLGFYTAKVYVLFWIAERLMQKWHWWHRGWLFFFCTLIYFFIVELLPFGTLLSLVFLLLGLGCMALYQLERFTGGHKHTND